MATIVKRGPYQYQAKIRKKGYPMQTRTFETLEEARRWAAAIEGEMARGVWVCAREAENTTLYDALERYEREVSNKKKGNKNEVYRIRMFQKSKLANRSLASIRSIDVARWRDERLQEVAPNTVKNDLILFSHLFTIAVKEWGMASLSNPVAMIRRPSDTKGRDRRLTESEETALIEALPQKVAAAMILAIETAMRRGELVALKRHDVDFRRQVALVRDSKTGDSREVPLSKRAQQIIKTLPQEYHGRVLGIGEGHISKSFKQACDKLGIDDLRFHDLRHEAASRLFEKGFNPMEVAAITGHKTLQMLKRYTHLKAEDLAKRL